MATIKQQNTLDDRQAQTDQAHEQLLSETYVPQTMPSILGKFDMTAMYVCVLVLLANAVIGHQEALFR